MIAVKSTTRFIDFYREYDINDMQKQYIPKTIDIKEVILNAIRFKCPNPVIYLSDLPDKCDENHVVIRSNDISLLDCSNSELYFKFNREDLVVILLDIDSDNRLIISISTSY